MSAINIVSLRKPSQTFVVLYRDEQRSEALRQVGKMASNPEIDFNWTDCCRLALKIRNIPSKTGGSHAAS